jgi:hypothetical protein
MTDENVRGVLRAAPFLGDKTSRIAAGRAPPTFAALALGRTIGNRWLAFQLVHRSVLTD